ncbi:MAG: DUF1080 domain-containing protein [Bifidobacteriaceae bacterium]|jgi:hypothetical protein|nr:DUF1080 domain-containing protein [Bifidobacteriaceae bacterium]
MAAALVAAGALAAVPDTPAAQAAVTCTNATWSTCADGSVVVDETFDTGLPSTWTVAPGFGANWTVANGKLTGSGATNSRSRLTFGQHLENYSIEAKLRFTSASGNGEWSWLGLILDYGQPMWSQASIRAGAGNGGYAGVRLDRSDGTDGNAATQYLLSSRLATGVNVWNFTTSQGYDLTFKVEVHGPSAQVLVNGQPVNWGGPSLATDQLPRTADGVLGLVVNGATVEFDQITVTKLGPAVQATTWSDVVAVNEPVSATFATSGGTATSLQATLFNRDGTVRAQRTVAKAASNATVIDFGAQPVGYYEFQVVYGNAQEWRRSIVVLPAGTAPAESRFGLDVHASDLWSGHAGGEAWVQQWAQLWRLAGFNSIRSDFYWPSVVTGWNAAGTNCAYVNANGDYYRIWDYFDDQGFDVTPLFLYAPACAQAGGDKSTPLNYEAMYEWGRQYALRAGQQARSVEVWNEPEYTEYWHRYPYEYAAALKAFAAGVASVDPGIAVLAGSRTSQLEKGSREFYTELYNNGIGAFTDVVNQHYYKVNGTAGNQPQTDYQYIDVARDQEAALDLAFGVDDQPAWLTETGYRLYRPLLAANRTLQEQYQAEYLVQAYALGFAAGYEKVFYFMWGGVYEAQFDNYLGIARPDDLNLTGDDQSLRPAYLAAALLTRFLEGTDPDQVAVQKFGPTGSNDDPDGRTVYFTKPDGSLVAVTWGAQNAPVLDVAGVTVVDIFGAQVAVATAKGSTSPYLVTLPAGAAAPNGARDVVIPVAQTTPAAPQTRLWTSSTVTVDGVTPGTRHVTNADGSLSQAVADFQPEVRGGQLLTLVATAHYGASAVAASAVTWSCSTGPGLTLVSASGSGTTYTCQWRAGQNVATTSYGAAQATYQGQTDLTRVDVDVTPGNGEVYLVNGAYPTWTSRAGGGATNAVSTSQADGWSSATGTVPAVGWYVTPNLTIPAGTDPLTGRAGLQIEISGVTGPLGSWSVELVEAVTVNGQLQHESFSMPLEWAADGVTATGYFDQATFVPWNQTVNSTLDLDLVRYVRLNIGPSGSGGTAGSYAFSFGPLKLVDPPDLFKPAGQCPTWLSPDATRPGTDPSFTHSSNLALVIASGAAAGLSNDQDRCATSIITTATSTGSAWAGPWMAVPESYRGTLAQASGLRLGVTNLAGLTAPPDLSVELAETDEGESWVVPLVRQPDGTYVADFATKTVNHPNERPNGLLDFDKVDVMSIVWGAWVTAGQQTGYRIDFVELLHDTPLAPVVSGVVLSGVAVPGEVLSVAVQGEHLAGAAVSYQWFRGTSVIAGVTGSSYRLAAADAGRDLVVKVTVSKPGFAAVVKYSNHVVVYGVSVLAVSGTPLVGSVLTASWVAGDAGAQLAFQWYRGTKAISGATGSAYMLGAGDMGQDVVLKLTVSRAGLAPVVKYSNHVEVLGASSAVLSGSPVVGSVLSVAVAFLPADAVVTFQWFRGTSVIAGVSGSSYRLTAADVGRDLVVKVTVSKSGLGSSVRYSNHVVIPG